MVYILWAHTSTIGCMVLKWKTSCQELVQSCMQDKHQGHMSDTNAIILANKNFNCDI